MNPYTAPALNPENEDRTDTGFKVIGIYGKMARMLWMAGAIGMTALLLAQIVKAERVDRLLKSSKIRLYLRSGEIREWTVRQPARWVRAIEKAMSQLPAQQLSHLGEAET